MVKVRSTHCVELVLTPKEIAAAFGHPEASVREAEVKLKDGKLEGLLVHLEYVIATKGVPKTVR